MRSFLLSAVYFFLLLIPRPPISTLFPYTTLFRSNCSEEMYQLVSNSPFLSATTSHGSNELASADSSTTIMLTVSDRKSTRLNSSHTVISYAVFCLKKKKKAIHIEPADTQLHHNTR